MVASLDKIGRREFLRAGLVFGAGAAGLAAGYAAVPDVFARAMYAAKQEKVVNDKVLVMIQLAGGNDGLQTVIPLADQTYRDIRPQLSKSADEALPISNDFGLNKNLTGTKKLWDDGKLAIVQGTGTRYDIGPVAAAIHTALENRRPVVHMGWHHGVYEFAARQTEPLPVLGTIAELQTWAQAHPDGLVVSFYPRFRFRAKPVFNQTFRGAEVSIWNVREALASGVDEDVAHSRDDVDDTADD